MLAAALAYLAEGVSVIPLEPASKRPVGPWRRWTVSRPTAADLEVSFAGGGRNIAAVCGSVSQNLFVLDCEGPQQFLEQQNRLAGLGLRTRRVQRPDNGSPHDGGGHVWLRSDVAVAWTRPAADLEVRGERSYVVCPPSEHTNGGRYDFLDDAPIATVRIADLPWLGLRVGTVRPARRRIPDLAWRILRGDGELLRQYLKGNGEVDRSWCETVACLSLVRNGWTFEDVLAVFVAEGNVAAGKFRSFWDNGQRQRALQYLGALYRSALRKTQQADRADVAAVRAKARAAQQWVAGQTWRGVAARSDRAVLLAHIDVALACGQEPHGASVRRIAELSGLAWPTVVRVHRRLCAAGLIVRVGQGSAAEPALWRLDLPRSEKVVVLPLRHMWDILSGNTTTLSELERHDLWRRGGLGKAGLSVWQVLTSSGCDGLTVADVGLGAGCTRQTVRRKLRTMFRLGMAEPLDRSTWRAVEGVDLDDAAVALGVAGAGERQRRDHERQRERRRLARVAWRQAQGNSRR